MKRLWYLLSGQLNDDVETLQMQLESNKKLLRDLRYDFDKLKWSIENPPKYKLGDKTKLGIVIDISIHSTSFGILGAKFMNSDFSWRYEVMTPTGVKSTIN